MTALAKTFYLFTGFHSFLLGLMPFFVSVILWDKGLGLSDICYFIALTAVGFLCALYAWDRLRAELQWKRLICLSFLFQSLFVLLLIGDKVNLIISVGAIINGAAGCFYWSTQRLLFQAITKDKNTGNTFGNFQILVMLSLKLGILVGSYLLGMGYFSGLLAISFTFSVIGFIWVNKSVENHRAFQSLKQVPAFTLQQVLHFKDSHKSRFIFMLDGLFLFLESYFWMLTIYLLTQQSVMQLGGIIILLSVSLAVIFFMIKKFIDHIQSRQLYRMAVIGYALSWLFRGALNDQMSNIMLYSGLLLVAFLSHFFRLAFNKRFYDIARQSQPTQYIICKSYYSQCMLFIFFTIVGLAVPLRGEILPQLQALYTLCVPLALLYYVYGRNEKGKEGGISANRVGA